MADAGFEGKDGDDASVTGMALKLEAAGPFLGAAFHIVEAVTAAAGFVDIEAATVVFDAEFKLVLKLANGNQDASGVSMAQGVAERFADDIEEVLGGGGIKRGELRVIDQFDFSRGIGAGGMHQGAEAGVQIGHFAFMSGEAAQGATEFANDLLDSPQNAGEAFLGIIGMILENGRHAHDFQAPGIERLDGAVMEFPGDFFAFGERGLEFVAGFAEFGGDSLLFVTSGGLEGEEAGDECGANGTESSGIPGPEAEGTLVEAIERIEMHVPPGPVDAQREGGFKIGTFRKFVRMTEKITVTRMEDGTIASVDFEADIGFLEAVHAMNQLGEIDRAIKDAAVAGGAGEWGVALEFRGRAVVLEDSGGVRRRKAADWDADAEESALLQAHCFEVEGAGVNAAREESAEGGFGKNGIAGEIGADLSGRAWRGAGGSDEGVLSEAELNIIFRTGRRGVGGCETAQPADFANGGEMNMRIELGDQRVPLVSGEGGGGSDTGGEAFERLGVNGDGTVENRAASGDLGVETLFVVGVNVVSEENGQGKGGHQAGKSSQESHSVGLGHGEELPPTFTKHHKPGENGQAQEAGAGLKESDLGGREWAGAKVTGLGEQRGFGVLDGEIEHFDIANETGPPAPAPIIGPDRDGRGVDRIANHAGPTEDTLAIKEQCMAETIPFEDEMGPLTNRQGKITSIGGNGQIGVVGGGIFTANQGELRIFGLNSLAGNVLLQGASDRFNPEAEREFPLEGRRLEMKITAIRRELPGKMAILRKVFSLAADLHAPTGGDRNAGGTLGPTGCQREQQQGQPGARKAAHWRGAITKKRGWSQACLGWSR